MSKSLSVIDIELADDARVAVWDELADSAVTRGDREHRRELRRLRVRFDDAPAWPRKKERRPMKDRRS